MSHFVFWADSVIVQYSVFSSSPLLLWLLWVKQLMESIQPGQWRGVGVGWVGGCYRMMVFLKKLVCSCGHHSYRHQNEKGAECSGKSASVQIGFILLSPSWLAKYVNTSVWTSHFRVLAFCSKNGSIHKEHNDKEFYSEAKVWSSHTGREPWTPNKHEALEHQITYKGFLFCI